MPIAIMTIFQVAYFLAYFRWMLPCCEKLPHAKFQADQIIFRGGGSTSKVFDTYTGCFIITVTRVFA